MNIPVKYVIIRNMAYTRLNEHYHACTNGISIRQYAINAFGRKKLGKAIRSYNFPWKLACDWPFEKIEGRGGYR